MSSTASVQSTQKQPAVEQTQPINEYEDAEKNYQIKSPKFWSVIVGIYFSIFLVALDRTIIATAIPKITDDFKSIQDIGWYGSAYMLSAACFCPVSGRVYQLYSTKWVFLIAIVVFEAGSTLCGAAPNSVSFIIGRAVAGLGAAFIFSGSIMIVIPLVPLRKRPVFVSFFGMAFGLASVLGPIVGGTFTDKVTWRWCFYVNLPIGAFTMIAVFFFLHIDSPKREQLSLFAQLKRIDPIGILFFVPSIVCLILALQWGGSTYAWSAPKIIGLLVTFAVLFVAFVAIEVLMPDTAMAPMRVVLDRSVGSAMVYMALNAGGMMSVVYYLTVWFQAAKGDSAMQAGINTIPLILALVVSGIAVAIFTQKVGYYNPALLVSPVLCAIGAGLLSTLIPTSKSSAWIGYQVLYGIGIGCGFQTSNLVPQVILPRSDVPLGMGLMMFSQQLGGAIFLAVSQNIFSSRLVTSLSGIAGLDANAIVNTGATELRKIVPASELETVVNAYSYALTRVFILTAALSAAMILGAVLLKWKKIEGKKQPKQEEKAATESVEAKGEEKV